MFMRLILADPDRDSRFATAVELEALGMDVTPVASAQRLLEVAATQGCEAVLVDAALADVGIWQLLKDIRQDYPELAVILLSRTGSVDQARKAFHAGASDYLVKPVTQERLSESLSRIRMGQADDASSVDTGQTFSEAVKQFQRDLIIRALRDNMGRRNETARQLGINRITLYKKMRKFGLLGKE